MNQENEKGIFIPQSITSSPSGKNYLFAIAINNYQHCTKLNNTVLDVDKFIQVLTARYNFETENVIRITDEFATKKRIEQELGRLAKTVTPQDNLVLYFSGHGRWDKHLGGHWIPVEAGTTDDDWPDYLSNDLVKSYLNRINSFHTFLIADSCFSGSLFIDKSKEKFSGDRRETEPSRWGLTSGKREIVSDGQPGRHSPFAAALLDVLNKADQPPPVMRICDLVLEKVMANATQTPMASPLAVKGHQGGHFVFHFRADEKTDWAAVKDTVNMAALEGFLKRHPAGEFAADARRRLEWLQDREALDRAFSLSVLGKFISYTPFDDLKKEARLRLEKMEDEVAWSKALRSQRLTSFLDYLQKFDHDGTHVKEAHAWIDDYEKQEEAERLYHEKLEKETLRKKQEEAGRREKDETENRRLQAEQERLEKEAAARRKKEEEEARRHSLDPFHGLMVRIEGGSFDMGGNEHDREKPIHKVTLDDFYLCKYPVTQAQWTKIMGSDPPQLAFPGCDQCPVEGVSWNDVQEFIKKLNEKTGKKFRLPTEAEWEYAARGGNSSKNFTYAGSNSIDEVAWYSSNSGSKTKPVGQKKANELGLYDMSGNVREWCSDWYDSSYYKQFENKTADNPQGPPSGSGRVVRGGSWFTDPAYCRSADRSDGAPGYRSILIGFRLVLVP